MAISAKRTISDFDISIRKLVSTGSRRLLPQTRQESRIKSPRQQISNMKYLAFALQVCEDNIRVSSELPNDLTTGPARRSQGFGVSNDGKLGKISLTFGECFPNGHSLGAHRQPVTRA